MKKSAGRASKSANSQIVDNNKMVIGVLVFSREAIKHKTAEKPSNTKHSERTLYNAGGINHGI
jgi:hypothetical protein